MKKLLCIMFFLSLFAAVAEEKWELIWENPKVEQYKHKLSFNSTYFFNQNVGFACTEDGKIYGTWTRAQDWELLYSNKDFEFEEIDFEEDYMGFVIGKDKTKPKGADGVLLFTQDCGNSWKRLETPNGIEFTALCMDNSTINVLFADENSRIYQLNLTTLTVEEKLQFKKVFEPKAPDMHDVTSIVKTKNSYFAMLDIDDKVPGSTKYILVGDQNGEKWDYLPLADNVEFKYATASKEIAYAITDDGKAIYSISDKEAKITKLYHNPSAELSEITIQRKDLIIACGDNGLIVYSTDEGKTWNTVQQKFRNDFEHIASGNNRTFIFADSLVLTKDNNREEWYDPTSPVSNPNYSQLYKDTLKAVYFLDEQTGFFVGNREKKLFRTFDGCKTIDTLSFKDQGWYVKQRFNTISFTDKQEGVILNDFAEAIHTTDGGKTWKNKHFSGPRIRNVNSVLYKKPYVFCAESSGRSFRCDFDDVYFTLYFIGDFGENKDAFSIDCYNGMPVAVGKNRSYVRDQNYDIEIPAVKGVNYNYPEDFNCIKMVNDVGFIVSNYGVIYRTTDNGLTWGVAKKFDKPLYSIHFSPQRPYELYAVGDGIIAHTKDMGETWTEETADVKIADYKFRSVFVTDNSVYAVGVNNVILRKKFTSSVVEDDTTDSEVFPNPAENEITIPNAGNKDVKIVDITGKTVLETKAVNGKVKIDTLPKGMYNAVVDGKSYKFMKE